MKSHLDRMVRAMAWADRKMLKELEACPAAWGTAGKIACHVLAAEHVWLARMLPREPAFDVWPPLSFEECKQLAAHNASGYVSYLAPRTTAQLSERITYRNTRGEQHTTTVGDIVTHVVIHGAYHRGQIAKLVAKAGGTSIDTDYISWVRSEGSAG